jgi:hypothetical protein
MDDDLLRFASQALRAQLARVLDDGDRDCTELIASCRALSRVFTTGRQWNKTAGASRNVFARLAGMKAQFADLMAERARGGAGSPAIF